VKPPLSILDPRFKYTPSHSTDLAATFARVRESLRVAASQERDRTALVEQQLQLAYARQDRIMLSLTDYLRGRQ
jgi:hypothetical protein